MDANIPKRGAEPKAGLLDVPINQLAPDPDQPRVAFDPSCLAELAANIQVRGIKQPITARIGDGDKYIIKTGERRWRAAKLAKLKTVPVLLEIHTELPGDRLVDQLSENMLRAQLSDLEFAGALEKLRVSGLSPTQIEKHLQAHGLKHSRSAISNTLRLLELPDWAKDLLQAGTITAAHARHILSAKDHPAWLESIGRVIKNRGANVPRVSEMDRLIYEAATRAGAINLRNHSGGKELNWVYGALFDVKKICVDSNCPHYRKVDNTPMCFNAAEFKRKQTEAFERREKRKAARETAATSGKVEKDPTKVAPRRIRETADGVIKLDSRPKAEYEFLGGGRMSAAKFDVGGCEGCAHNRLGSPRGTKDGAEAICFYPPCFENKTRQVQREEARTERFKEAIDELLMPFLWAKVAHDRRAKRALIAYYVAGMPNMTAQIGEHSYAHRTYQHHSLEHAFRDKAVDTVYSLTSALDAYAKDDAGEATELRLAEIAYPLVHHEQRRELARWLGVRLDEFYRPTATLAKLYRKAELIELIDPSHKTTGWTPSLPTRPTTELQTMFVDNPTTMPPANLGDVWDSPIGNVRSPRSIEGDDVDDDPMRCRYCGCAQMEPCELDDGPCGWHIAPAVTDEGDVVMGVCTNPECLEALAILAGRP
jgi:ParB family chromosome partitioning protein